MKNAAWGEFVQIRSEQQGRFAQLLSVYLSGNASDMMLGRIAGSLHMLIGLPYSRGARDEIERAIDSAHAINRRLGVACGCGTRKRCHLAEVSPDQLIDILAETDPPLQLGPFREDFSWDE